MKLRENAIENADGDLIYKETVVHETGDTSMIDINVTRLLTPGQRRTADTSILLQEAERAHEGDCPGNPALPANQETARSVMQRFAQRDLEPAWKRCPHRAFPPQGGDGE